MKPHGMFVVFLASLISFFQCKYEEKTLVSEEIPINCNLSGIWHISITVGDGSHLPAGTTLSAIMSLDQFSEGKVSGTIVLEGVSTADVAGTVTGDDFQFEINQGVPCISKYVGSGKASLDCTKLSGNYSGTDCLGTLKADFVSTSFTPRLYSSTID
jgi:hypothetical protein